MVDEVVRFTRSRPCPICAGYDGAPRGNGVRCWGFQSGDWAHCTREERGGGLPRNPDSNTFAHRLVGDCNCGTPHGPTPYNGPRKNPTSPAGPARTVRYAIVDAQGVQVAEHVRLDLPDGSKKFVWRRNGTDGLEGLPVKDLPLYGLPRLADAPEGSRVVVTEGERAADALLDVGVLAVGTVTGARSAPAAKVLADALAGFDVYLWPDADGDGGAHMAKVASRMLQACLPAPRVVTWPDAPAKGDAADYIDANGTDGLEALLSKAVSYAPPTPTASPETPTSLPFRTAQELSKLTQERPEWIVEGLLVRGGITELDGKVKAGKSTLMMAMQAAILRGKPFLGLISQATAVLYLTEERTPSFRALLDRVGLADENRLYVLSRTDVQGVPWELVVILAVEKAQEVGAGVIVVDTLSKWANLKDDSENSAGPAMQAMMPLENAAATGLAVLIGRHDRKSGGELGDSGRGSSAYSGIADIILSLRRADTGGHTSRRSLLGVGRFEGIPEQLIVEFKDGQYVALGDSADVERKEAREKVLDVLPGPDDPPGPMLGDLVKETGSKRSTLQRVLKDLVEEGIAKKNPGAGKTRRGEGFTLVEQEKQAPTIGVTPGHSPFHPRPKADVPKEPPKGTPRGHKPLESGVPRPHSLSGRSLSRARAQRAVKQPAPAAADDADIPTHPGAGGVEV